jgi:quinol monooxygenase YgiN
MPGAPIIVTTRYRINTDRQTEALAAAMTLADALRGTPGCREFRVLCDWQDAQGLFLFQSWESADAMTACFQHEAMAEFQATLRRLRVAEPEVSRYRIAA